MRLSHAKPLYLCKQKRHDMQTSVAFLCTRVKEPDEDNYSKLVICVPELKNQMKTITVN